MKSGYQFVCFAVNSLILMYMKWDMSSAALSTFSGCIASGLLSLVSYNVATSGVVENEQTEKRLEIFKLISACCHCNDESKGLGVFREMVMDTNVKATRVRFMHI